MTKPNHERETPPRRPADSVLSQAEIRGLTDFMRRTIWQAADAEGHRITVVDAGEDRCTVFVDDPGSENSSTVILGKAAAAELAESLRRWLNQP